MKKVLLALVSLSLLVTSVFAKNSVVMLRDDGNACVRADKGNGGFEWFDNIPAGTVLELVSDNVVVADRISSKSTDKDIEFYKVSYKKGEYYVVKNEVAVCNTVSITIKDQTIFTKPAISSFTNAQLEKLSYVTVNSVPVSNNGIDFVEVSYWSSKNWRVVTNYVLAGNISSNKDDIRAMQLVEKAKALSDSEIDMEKKKVILSGLKGLNLSAEVFAYTYNNRVEMIGEDEEPVSETITEESEESTANEEIEEWATGHIINAGGDKINIRATPMTGEVLFQLSDGDRFTITKETVNEYEINGNKDKWFYITYSENDKEQSGWVFGYYIYVDMAE